MGAPANYELATGCAGHALGLSGLASPAASKLRQARPSAGPLSRSRAEQSRAAAATTTSVVVWQFNKANKGRAGWKHLPGWRV